MLFIDTLPEEFCRRLSCVFVDLDDTLTTGGLLPPHTYASLWKLYDQGIDFVGVTGRPAGWCDHIARMWPAAGVVGENGAFYFSYDRKSKKMKRRYSLSEPEREKGRRKLERVRERVLREVPGCGVAADQPYRIADLAVDFCEDVPPLGRDQVKKICAVAADEGAQYRVSSIHVNCWYGDFNKLSCVKAFIKEELGREFEAMQEEILFIGDSPNDEPMFEEFVYSAGVANLKAFLEDMTHLPRYLTKQDSSKGFQETVHVILRKRQSGFQSE